MIAPRLFFKLLRYKTTADKDHDFKLIGRYFHNRPADGCRQTIPANVANDIDFDQIFKKIDRTSSRIGQQYLYAKMRTIGSKADLLKFDAFVSVFEQEDPLRGRVKKQLSKLTSPDGYYFEELFQGKNLDVAPLTLPYILTSLAVLFVVLAFFNSLFLLAIIPVYITNLILHYRNKRNISYYVWGVSELSKSLKLAKKLVKEPLIKSHFGSTAFVSDLMKTELKASFITFEKRNDNDPTNILFAIIELLKISVNFEVIMFHKYLDDIVEKRDSLRSLFGFIGEVDSAISISELKNDNYELCKPIFVDSKHIETKDIIHPLVDNCIANSLSLEGKSLLLTGSNMSGKTTFIRALTINALLAQTIYRCFATEYKAPYLKIFTSIRIADSVEDKTSYFLEEVMVIKKFTDQVPKEECCLFVLDEIFRGTNTLERVAASKGVLAFLNSGKHIVVASTHDIELTDLLSTSGYECYHFSEQIINGELIFDYRLHEGRLKTKNAIKILELYDFPRGIISDAEQTQVYLSKSAGFQS